VVLNGTAAALTVSYKLPFYINTILPLSFITGLFAR